jgi:hypothetical protein
MCGLVLGGGAGLNHWVAANPAAAPAQAPPPRPAKALSPVLVTAALDKTHVHPGDAVRLTELVPIDREIRVHSVNHVVYTIGQIDRATGELVNRDPEQPLYAGVQAVFGPSRGSVMVLGDKPLRYSVMNPRQEGLEFEFKAQEPGIFLVTARWHLWRSDQVIESNPVVLTVCPAAKGGGPDAKQEPVDPTGRR